MYENDQPAAVSSGVELPASPSWRWAGSSVRHNKRRSQAGQSVPRISTASADLTGPNPGPPTRPHEPQSPMCCPTAASVVRIAIRRDGSSRRICCCIPSPASRGGGRVSAKRSRRRSRSATARLTRRPMYPAVSPTGQGGSQTHSTPRLDTPNRTTPARTVAPSGDAHSSDCAEVSPRRRPTMP